MSTVEDRIDELSKSFQEIQDDGLAVVLDRIGKDLTAGDVHVTSAGSEDDKRKPKPLAFDQSSEEDDHAADDAATKRASPRALRPIDAQVSHTPFSWDANALGNVRPDQTPRFLAALTDAESLETRSVNLNTLHSVQNRVDHGKVEAMRQVIAAGNDVGNKPPVVVRMGGKNVIVDGHHRLAAQWLNGEQRADVKFKDISPVTNAVKRATADGESWSLPFTMAKADAEHRLVFGWASIVEKDGYVILDKQDDAIPPWELEQAAYDYVLTSRAMDDMHTDPQTGRLVESMVFTREKQEKLGIRGLLKNDQGEVIDTAWWCGWYLDCDKTWDAIKRGERPELSIGGTSTRQEIA